MLTGAASRSVRAGRRPATRPAASPARAAPARSPGSCGRARPAAPGRCSGRRRAGRRLAGREQVDHAGLDLVPMLKRLAARGTPSAARLAAHHVGHVHVVAGLRAVAEDQRRLAREQLAEEDRDHAGLAVRILARPVDVAVAERDVARPVEPVGQRQVLLGAELARCRRAPSARAASSRPRGSCRPRRRARRRSTRTRPGRRAAARPRAPRSCPSTLTSASNTGIVDRDADVGLRGQVEDRLRAAPRQTGRRPPRGRARRPRRARAPAGTRSRLPAGEVVDHGHLGRRAPAARRRRAIR